MDMMFQSLFYWILFLRRKKGLSNPFRLSEVSILVLLDFVLKASQKREVNP